MTTARRRTDGALLTHYGSTMSEDKSTTRGGGRPAREDRSTIAGAALQVRVTPAERETLERLVTLRNEELADEGAHFTASSFIRYLLRREARAKGIAIGASPPQAPAAGEEHEPEERPAPAAEPAPMAKPWKAPKATRAKRPPEGPAEVRALVDAANVTQADLADEAGVSRATVSSFMTGKTDSTPETRGKLAAAAGKLAVR
jgi:DNA-binding XRE family transcriptional regulator